ncbi:MAG: hypothetical protein KatS3mg002_0329 [Candidatus Woesearchaeota archaeon]|nr:MAG: hypothetical protein KatS3mg002_0329 [Candidatus Woesearchaeota archaeon]
MEVVIKNVKPRPHKNIQEYYKIIRSKDMIKERKEYTNRKYNKWKSSLTDKKAGTSFLLWLIGGTAATAGIPILGLASLAGIGATLLAYKGDEKEKYKEFMFESLEKILPEQAIEVYYPTQNLPDGSKIIFKPDNVNVPCPYCGGIHIIPTTVGQFKFNCSDDKVLIIETWPEEECQYVGFWR